MASVLLFLICQDTRGHQAKPFCVCFGFFSVLYYCYYLVNFALFWRFATLERYYAEKWWCIFALFHEDDCKSNKSQSVKGTYSFILFFSLQYFKIHYVTALTCTMLCSQLPFYFFSKLSWLSLWHSTTEKDRTAIPSQTSVIICLVWCQ